MANDLQSVSFDYPDTDHMLDRINENQYEIGSGGGGAAGSFLRVDKHTGELTFGKDNVPLPPNHRFVLGLHNIQHGYVVWNAARKQPMSRHMASMALQGAAPIPPGGAYSKYGEDGPRKCIELTFESLDEPGFILTFSSMAVSNDNRIRRGLLEKISLRRNLPETKIGFVHPVVIIKSSWYKHADFGKINTIDFDIIDWMQKDGTLLSERRKLTAAPPEAPRPKPGLDDEDMTELERDLMRL